MKAIYTFCVLLSLSLCAAAQKVKPYLAIVKTNSGTSKGVLYRVDSTGLVMESDDKIVKININEIRLVKIKAVKKEYQPKQFANYDPWNENNFDKQPNGTPLRKWGEKDPTLKEEISGHIGAGIINVAGNLIAAPIHSISGSIVKFQLKGNEREKAAQLKELVYFSIHYQTNPDVAAELRQLKISGKPDKS